MSTVASAHFVRFVVALAYPAFEAVTAQPKALGSTAEMLYRPSTSVMVRCPPTKMRTPSRGVGRVGVTADMTPERVMVGSVGVTSAVGVVGPLLPQAHTETARLKTSDERFTARNYTPLALAGRVHSVLVILGLAFVFILFVGAQGRDERTGVDLPESRRGITRRRKPPTSRVSAGDRESEDPPVLNQQGRKRVLQIVQPHRRHERSRCRARTMQRAERMIALISGGLLKFGAGARA
jgi:hypothetical protein